MTRRILYLQYASPGLYPPVQHSARILADRGWQVAFLGVEAPTAPTVAMPSHPRIDVRLLGAVPPGHRLAHYLRFSTSAAASALRWRPDWIYVSDAPASPAGLLAGAACGARLVYHEHDAPSAGPGRRQPWTRGVALRARRRIAHRAAVRVLPNARRVTEFLSTCGLDGALAERTLCVWNCPSRDEAVPVTRSDHGDGCVLHYQGSLNAFRLPWTLLEGLALVREPVRLQIVGYETAGHAGFAAEWSRRARALHVDERVAVLPAAPRQRVLAMARRADAGLAVISAAARDRNLEALSGASNKAFEYLACGLPLIVADTPEWRRFYVDPGYGLAVDPDDPRDVAAALRWLAAHRDQARAMGERGRERIAGEWNYETQFEPVLRLLERGGAAA